jgi:hypothetical protein
VERSGVRLVLAIALAKLALNVAFHGQYGYFRDELYYLACSDTSTGDSSISRRCRSRS